jgi:hypothetical protein
MREGLFSSDKKMREGLFSSGHDGKTSWYGSNRNGVASRLRSQQSTQKPALFAKLARSLCTAGET